MIDCLILIGISWKTHPDIFPKFHSPGRELDRYLEKLSIFGCPYHDPEFLEYHFLLNAQFRMSSPEIGYIDFGDK